MTIQEIRSNLRAIRYYYSKQKEFDKAAETVGESKVVETVKRYNQAVANAPPRLYKVYVELYVHNNTQEAVSFVGTVAWSISGSSTSSYAYFF